MAKSNACVASAPARTADPACSWPPTRTVTTAASAVWPLSSARRRSKLDKMYARRPFKQQWLWWCDWGWWLFWVQSMSSHWEQFMPIKTDKKYWKFAFCWHLRRGGFVFTFQVNFDGEYFYFRLCYCPFTICRSSLNLSNSLFIHINLYI